MPPGVAELLVILLILVALIAVLAGVGYVLYRVIRSAVAHGNRDAQRNTHSDQRDGPT